MHRCLPTRLLLALPLALAAGGCKHADSDFYRPSNVNYNLPSTTGSLSEMKRKTQRAQSQGQSGAIVLLVAYDAQGKPLGTELKASSGNAEMDGRARELVLKSWRFPAGHADTAVVAIDPKTLPKK